MLVAGTVLSGLSGLSSLAGRLAASAAMLTGTRPAQGLGAAMMTPAALSTLTGAAILPGVGQTSVTPTRLRAAAPCGASQVIACDFQSFMAPTLGRYVAQYRRACCRRGARVGPDG